jgi:hypothetical protein
MELLTVLSRAWLTIPLHSACIFLCFRWNQRYLHSLTTTKSRMFHSVIHQAYTRRQPRHSRSGLPAHAIPSPRVRPPAGQPDRAHTRGHACPLAHLGREETARIAYAWDWASSGQGTHRCAEAVDTTVPYRTADLAMKIAHAFSNLYNPLCQNI